MAGTRDDSVCYKVALCGSKNVGKSSIFVRLRDETFDPTLVASMHGMNQEGAIRRTLQGKEVKVGIRFIFTFHSLAECFYLQYYRWTVCSVSNCGYRLYTGLQCSTETLSLVKMQIRLWDTLGFEEHATLSRSHYKDSHVILVVYSSDVQNSLAEAKTFRVAARMHSPQAKIALVRNKIDLDPDGFEDGGSVGRDYDFCIKISAKTGEGTEEMLQMIYQRFLRHSNPLKKRRSRHLSVSSSSPSELRGNASSSNDMTFNISEDEPDSQSDRCKICWIKWINKNIYNIINIIIIYVSVMFQKMSIIPSLPFPPQQRDFSSKSCPPQEFHFPTAFWGEVWLLVPYPSEYSCYPGGTGQGGGIWIISGTTQYIIIICIHGAFGFYPPSV